LPPLRNMRDESERDETINNLSLSKQDVQKINELYKYIVSKNLVIE